MRPGETWPAVLGLALASTFVFAAPARAQPAVEQVSPPPQPPRILVVALDPARAHEVEPAYAELRAAGTRVVEREDRAGLDLPADVALERNARVDEVRAALLEARAHLQALEVDRAGASLNQARALVRRLADPAAHRELIAEVLLERATLLLARDAADAAAAELALLARLDPERDALHPGLYPPNLVAAYAEVRAAASAGSALLTAVPRPRGAQLLVDAIPAAPGVPLPLAPGPHWVTVQRAGRVTVTRELNLSPDASLLLAPLAPAPGAGAARAAALERLRAGEVAAAGELLELTGADTLLALAPAGRLLVERRGLRRELARAPGVSLAAATLSTLQALERPAPGPAPPPEPEGVDPAWWLAGGGAAAVLAGAAIGLSVWYLTRPEVDLTVPRPVVVTCCSL